MNILPVGIIIVTLIVTYTSLIFIERLWPLRRATVGLKLRWFPNMTLTWFSLLIALSFSPFTYFTRIYIEKHLIDLLNDFNLKGIYYTISFR